MDLSLLQQFFQNNPERQQDYADFIQRYQDNPASISDEEAARRYREIMRHTSTDAADEANEQAFGGLPVNMLKSLAGSFLGANNDPNRPYDGYNYNDEDEAAQPRNVGRMARRAEEQDPDLLTQLLGKDSPLNSDLGRAALAGGAAYLASRALSGKGGTGIDLSRILSRAQR